MASVLTSSGTYSLVELLSTDQEGLTYRLIDQGQDRSVTHWWPFDEVVAVSNPKEPGT